MSGPKPRGLKRPPRPCAQCGTETTNYCNWCKRPYCPDHLILKGRGVGWFCEDCESQRAEEEVSE